jgi:hypothetical protein
VTNPQVSEALGGVEIAAEALGCRPLELARAQLPACSADELSQLVDDVLGELAGRRLRRRLGERAAARLLARR